MPPSLFKDPALLRASLDVNVLSPEENGRRRNNWQRKQRRHGACVPSWPRAETDEMDQLIEQLNFNPGQTGRKWPIKNKNSDVKLQPDSQESKVKKNSSYQSEEISSQFPSKLKLTRIKSNQNEKETGLHHPSDESNHHIVAMMSTNSTRELAEFT